MKELISNCCSSPDRSFGNDSSYSDFGLCSDCRGYCEYIDPDELCETCGYEECQCVVDYDPEHVLIAKIATYLTIACISGFIAGFASGFVW